MPLFLWFFVFRFFNSTKKHIGSGYVFACQTRDATLWSRRADICYERLHCRVAAAKGLSRRRSLYHRLGILDSNRLGGISGVGTAEDQSHSVIWQNVLAINVALE